MVLLEEDQIKECLLIDFGFAVQVKDKYQQKNLCGTLNYMAPEIFDRKVIDGSSIDIWALGVILFKLITSEFPFQVTKNMKKSEYIRKTFDFDPDLSILFDRFF